MTEKELEGKETEGPANVSKEELGEMLESIKINEDDSDIEIEKAAPGQFSGEGGKVDKATMELYEEFGEFLKVKADITADTGVKVTIPTGIDVLDAALGGGFIVGGLSIIVGSPGSAKSMLAIQTLGSAQKKFKGSLISFLDSEEATTKQRLYNLGVKYPPVEPYTDITIEKLFKHLETICLFKEKKGISDIPSVLCWDSIANTLSEKEREVEDVNSVIGYKARLLSLLIPKYVSRCGKYGIAWLAINQMRESLSMGPFSQPKDLRFLSTGKTLPGGQSLKYNAFTLLEMKAKAALDPEKMGFEGMLFTATTVKNKLMPPNITVEIVGDYVKGFNNFRTNYHFLVKEKRLKTGAWNSLISDPEKKQFRTKDAENLYNTDERFRGEFDKAVKECIQTEIVDKYNPKIT